MTSARGVARAAVVAAAVLMAAGAALADTHAPWPVDWNNWSDPALWVTVRNAGNDGEWSGEHHGGYGPPRICGAVGYNYKMGKFEVTAAQYTAFLNAVAATDTYGLYNEEMASAERHCGIERTGPSGNYKYSVAADWANRPVDFVSWGDAARFANWLTNGRPRGAQDGSTTEDGSYCLNGATSDGALMTVTRIADAARVLGKEYYCIPTEDEWYKAAYHKNDGVTGNYWDYPAGTDAVPSNDVVEPDPGNNANFYISDGDFTLNGPYWRTEVGEFENSESAYGTFDQGGNVHEWNEAVLEGSYRAGRGGWFYCDERALRAAVRAYGGLPTSEYYDVGFRIAMIPEPATMSLLALGGLVLLRRRRASA